MMDDIKREELNVVFREYKIIHMLANINMQNN